MRRSLVPIVLALVTATTGVLAVRLSAGTTSARATTAVIRVPVLSPRRAPVLLARVVADARLRSRLDTALANPVLGQGREQSCIVVHQGSRPIMARRPDQQLIPASNLKVLTAMAALTRLGPDERLVTEVRVARPLGADGVVDGPLWLVGGGDPLLATADYAASFENQPQLYTSMEALADTVTKAGVRHVRGGIVGDESRYDKERYVPTWRPGYITDSESGPASALDVNDGFTQFQPRRVAAAAPDAHAAGVLAALLQARGVTVEGTAASGVAPKGAPVVATIDSHPVGALVGQMLRESDNLTAELLVKELGHRFAGAGTRTAGLGVVRQTLESTGLPVHHYSAVDGSGLDRSDRASCTLLMAALVASGPRSPVAAGLPGAGRDGTLARRFQGSPAAGRLRAKTGSLREVAALTGYVDPLRPGEPLVFSMMINALPSDATGRAVQEQLGAILAGYPEAPEPEELAP